MSFSESIFQNSDKSFITENHETSLCLEFSCLAVALSLYHAISIYKFTTIPFKFHSSVFCVKHNRETRSQISVLILTSTDRRR